VAFVGDLVFPEVAVLRLLDTNAQAVAGDYDEDFREPEIPDTNDDQLGEPVRTEQAEIKVRAQVTTATHQRLGQAEHGAVLEVPNFELTFHFRDLNALGLVESDGRPKIQIGTRLVRIENKAGKTLFDYPLPEGMFITATRHSGHMLGQANLWVCTLSDRRQAAGGPRPTQV
jgi:hypothetical protein